MAGGDGHIIPANGVHAECRIERRIDLMFCRGLKMPIGSEDVGNVGPVFEFSTGEGRADRCRLHDRR